MLQLSQVTVERGGVPVAAAIDVAVDRGEVVALLGPSGAGKSSLLLAVAGLVPTTAGTITIGGRDATGLPPHRRGVGMVFQEYALFPHLSVGENIAYGLHGDQRSATDRADHVSAWLERVGLDPATYRDRDVATLSGGQRQRVALARALAPSPPVLLLDEPLGALDRQLREELLLELKDVVAAADGPAVVVVTHDRDEAFTLGDRVGVLRGGRLVQLDPPGGLWARPVDAWTARFLGHPNVLSADQASTLGLEARDQLLPIEAVTVSDGGATSSATVTTVAWKDGRQRVTADITGVPVTFELPSRHASVTAGDVLALHLDGPAATPLDGAGRGGGVSRGPRAPR